jgi:quercetin dioxygenase-like cupin family protein
VRRHRSGVKHLHHPVVEIRPGDTVYTPAGEWHWHGAAPDHFMTHIAMWEAPADGPETEWGDLVTDTVPGER